MIQALRAFASSLVSRFLLAGACCAALASATPQPARAADERPGPLVSVAWLKPRLAAADVLLLDASMPQQHAQAHIQGAVAVNPFALGGRELTPAALQRLVQGWGLSAGRKVVIYDVGGTFMAARVWYDIVHGGFPAEDVHILDGGLAKWRAEGGAVTQERTIPPAPGTFRVTALREEMLARLPEVLVASGEPARQVLVEALEPTYHFGENKFFDRAGHLPHAVMWPNEDFFNADKTLKSPDELRRMARHLGITPDKAVHTYCGGGGAAALTYFALKAVLGYPQVKLYKGSQHEWLQDPRQLPMWTYSAPALMRDTAWVAGWGGPMLRAFGFSNLAVIDVRAPQAYGAGHVPFALNIPAATFARHAGDAAALAAVLGPAGVSASHEAIIVSEGGITPDAALALAVLEQAGHKRVSILMDSVDDWGLKGQPIAKEPTLVGRPTSPQQRAVPPATYTAAPRADGPLVSHHNAANSVYPKVYLAAGAERPAKAPHGTLVHVPYKQLLNADGTPKPAKDLWSLLARAGVPRYAQIVCVADNPGEAAAAYYVLKLMGFADVKVLLA